MTNSFQAHMPIHQSAANPSSQTQYIPGPLPEKTLSPGNLPLYEPPIETAKVSVSDVAI
ncbi:hypothetical protein [Moorella sp. E308F]|uniref:hypothetical protein n=1 Tax=Moorella sp. E308F TaxID=2572682 RepID=UPI001C0EC3E0|nr:hypothetical protein [Moorella sp. E308F]